MDILLLLVALLVTPTAVSAHGAVTSYEYEGKTYPGFDGFNPSRSTQTAQRAWPNYDPIMSVTDPKMLCNGGGPAPLNITVEAGRNFTARWKQWTHQQGPVMVWMYDCEGADFSACDGKARRWFKIEQAGLSGNVLASNNWGTAIVYRQLYWTTRIPEKLTPGNYLMRHELLALHQTNTPQFYPECVQLVVRGSGTAKPAESCLTTIPGYAKQSDPGVTVCAHSSPTRYSGALSARWLLIVVRPPSQVDIYNGGLTSYTPPGPPVCRLS